MNWCCRFLPLAELERRYLDEKEYYVGGFWYPDKAVAGFKPHDLIRLLNLNYVGIDGQRALGDGPLGALRFPLDDNIREASTMLRCVDVGGHLPTPPAQSQWPGNGFTSGALLVPEFSVAYCELPQESHAVSVDESGDFTVLARWNYRRWNMKR
jgi:hypothetical protein